MRRLFSMLLLAAGTAAIALFTGAAGDEESGKRYEIVFDNAFGLVEGGDLKIGGVIAGETTGFQLEEKPPYRVVAEVVVDEPGFASFRTDAECDVRQQSLIGEYFVDCDIGEEPSELPDGGRVPVEQTSSTIPLDLIQNVMRRPYRERFRLILSELGTGLAGRPQELNEVVRRAHPALRETSETFEILADHNRIIRDFIENADQVSAEVEPFREDLARWAQESSDTAGIQASRSEELGRYWNRLPRFLAELEPTMAQLERTASRQIPTLQRLRRAAPDLQRFFVAVQPFARSSRASLSSLGEAAVTGRGAIAESGEEIAELRALAEDAPRLGKPLRQFLQAIDDRRRSYEDDPEAGLRAPPAPDKTAYRDGQGYTGMENLFNYIYWQTLGINAFDELGHLLRVGLLAGGSCLRYTARPDQELIDSCASWLGPFQPGVTDPDPTAGAGEAAALERTARRSEDAPGPAADGPAVRATEPLPGQPDRSRPQIVLPRAVQELVDRLGGLLSRDGGDPPGDARQAPGSGGADGQLLDYLLTP
ncbi:MAG: MlaD family protein [Thermoleophilaceae bacterium]